MCNRLTLPISGLTAPAEEDDYQNDNYDDDDQYDDTLDSESTETSTANPSNKNIRLVTKSHEQIVDAHIDVTLNCQVEGDDESKLSTAMIYLHLY